MFIDDFRWRFDVTSLVTNPLEARSFQQRLKVREFDSFFVPTGLFSRGLCFILTHQITYTWKFSRHFIFDKFSVQLVYRKFL